MHSDGELIEVRGARVHNLRNLDVDLPRDRLIVITGVSGSGKSSLAFDCLFAEGQRRYIESLSAYARQFVEQLERPDVDLVEGLPPTLSIDQRAAGSNPRSTVATVTEIHDYLRLLYARAGTAHCPQCGEPIRPQTPEQIVDWLLQLEEGRRVMLLAPLVRGRKGQHVEVFERIRRDGFVRARVDGQVVDTSDPPRLARQRWHTIEAVVDRIVVREGVRPRLAESVKLALKHGGGVMVACYEAGGKWHDRLSSVLNACPRCHASFPALEPRSFSFNSPYGACPACDGLGYVVQFDPDLVVPERKEGPAAERPLDETLHKVWRRIAPRSGNRLDELLAAFARSTREPVHTPTGKLKPRHWETLFFGDGKSFGGLLRELELVERSTSDERRREALGGLRGKVVCSACGGGRLRPESQAVRFGGLAIHEFSALSVDAARDALGRLVQEQRGDLDAVPAAVVREPLEQITRRLAFLSKVGLGYLTLDRAADSLSGGELQRTRLAAHLGSGLVGVCYVLDEPTVGLHPRDNDRLIDALDELRDEGSTVIVVEHDETMMRRADYLIDLGPGAGDHGGRITAAGPVERLLEGNGRGRAHAPPLAKGGLPGGAQVARRRSENGAAGTSGGGGPSLQPLRLEGSGASRADTQLSSLPSALCPQLSTASLTVAYLRGERAIRPPERRRRFDPARVIVLEGARTNNLKAIDVAFPVGLFTCVTGVSGSGKSSLVTETLVPALARRTTGSGPKPGPYRSLRGAKHLERVVLVDQSPIGRTPRSNAATYTGVFDEIRKVFARTREARLRGYRPTRFSFNVKGGRCEACQGQGQQRIEMNFLPELYVTCPECRGARFNRQTLEIRYRGKPIAAVLDMAVVEALEFFENFPAIRKSLASLAEVGLGYLKLGQPSTTLSGGEAQRVKLATELARTGGDDPKGGAGSLGARLYVLDEPTTGLHFADVERLLAVLGQLVERGHTVVVIEHHIGVIRSADWVIDLGPDGGEAGGRVVVAGTPEDVAACRESITGRYLAGGS